MNFASSQYLIFFTLVFIVYWSLSRRQQNLFILGASYFFYANWDWRFLGLIFVATVVAFVTGSKCHQARSISRKRVWLVVSLVVNLGILGYFKYFNFFAESLVSLGQAVGWTISHTTVRIILPVGISFYTFQTLSYTLDIYRGQLTPTRSFVDFAAFTAFFPQLVAGPIVRAKEFLYQLENPRVLSRELLDSGLKRILYGLFMKAFVADTLGVLVVDPVFADPAKYSQWSLWVGLIGYSAQVYADFSGYSSMAIGSSKLLGFDIPENFNFPYLARSISEYWRRWHMTMSRFFRDYVYFSLGGSRRSYPRVLLNLGVTTLVSGLWHGAGWNFVIWGGLHGIYLAVNQEWRKKVAGRDGNSRIPTKWWSVIPAWVTTFFFLNITRVLFRSSDFDRSWIFFKGLFSSLGETHLQVSTLAGTAFLAVIIEHTLGGLKEHGKLDGLGIPDWVLALIMAAAIVFIFHGRPDSVDPFIYFQF